MLTILGALSIKPISLGRIFSDPKCLSPLMRWVNLEF